MKTADEVAELATKHVVRVGGMPEENLVRAVAKEGFPLDVARAGVVVAKTREWLVPSPAGPLVALAVGPAWWERYAEPGETDRDLDVNERMTILARGLEDAGALDRLKGARLSVVARLVPERLQAGGKKDSDG